MLQEVMEIRTFKSGEYRGCNIYFRNIGTMFEYFAIVNTQLYSANIVAIPRLSRRGVHAIYSKFPLYTESQISGAIKCLSTMARTTVDLILDPPEDQQSVTPAQVLVDSKAQIQPDFVTQAA